MRPIDVFLAAALLVASAPRLPGEMVLVSRSSDAIASASSCTGSDNPSPQTQTDFMPASLSNSASVESECGPAYSYSESTSSITVDNAMGTMNVAGYGHLYVLTIGNPPSTGHSSANVITLNFTLTDFAYAFSLTGQLSQYSQCAQFCFASARAKLTSGNSTIFDTVASPTVDLSETGSLPPGNYELSVTLDDGASGNNFGSGPSASASFTFALNGPPSPTPTPTATPSPAPTSTPHDCDGTARIFGSVFNCSAPLPTATPPANPTPPQPVPVPGVLITASGSSSSTDGSGNYSLTVLAGSGTTYTITPSKGTLDPGSGSINTTDVLAIERHFLGLTIIPGGCRLNAADVVIDGSINTLDVIATQRFYLGLTNGIGSAGQYKFLPANKTLSLNDCSISTQNNFNTYVVGDVAAPIANRASVPDDAPTERNR